MNKKITEDLMIEKIAKNHGITKKLAKKIYTNCLIYSIVQEQIYEQAKFLIDTQTELF